ncbi:YopX family protein [Bacillus atrophaeus]|uniref:YopX family protein n=1 Tax=Bacillus atrophaeus TaxID=1452 RepID=UPI00227F2919|nr:YopX family protein [Bacillus atrophaeus]MCY8837586.1 YopX family protein [Bacillus atrophaeus]
MREIKFRMYSKKKKVMHYWDHIKQFQMAALDDNDENEKYSPWMQYTGLEDTKNGREIYQGDVIEVFKAYKSFKAIVKFGNYNQDGSGAEYSPTECIGFYAEAIQPNQKDEFGCHLISDYEEEMSLLEFDSIEIIGNIYEDPELLEEVE